MKAHWSYLKYVLRHKWFVFIAGLRTGAPLWRLIIHDWTKFLPCEWTPYVDKFYGNKVDEKESDDYRYWSARGPVDAAFNHAWNHHQKANKHHWQYWLLTNDLDDPKHQALQMPHKYALEMVSDWMGAGRAISGKWDFHKWYWGNERKIILHDQTRIFVEVIIDRMHRRQVLEDEAIKQRIRILGS